MSRRAVITVLSKLKVVGKQNVCCHVRAQGQDSQAKRLSYGRQYMISFLFLLQVRICVQQPKLEGELRLRGVFHDVRG